jgi:hypothetical protein
MSSFSTRQVLVCRNDGILSLSHMKPAYRGHPADTRLVERTVFGVGLTSFWRDPRVV